MSSKRQLAFVSLRHRDFRLLWMADIVAVLGTQIQRTAIIWHVFQITNVEFALGLLGLFRFAPILFFGLFGGVIADRRDRRKILVVTHLALMATMAVLAFAERADAASLWLIYTITFVSSAFNAFAGPARQAIIPSLVPRAEISGATTVTNLAMQAAQIAGPAVGGLMIGRFGLESVYIVGTVTFIAVVIAALMIKTRVTVTVSPEAQSGWRAVREGLVFLWATPILLSVMALDFLATFFAATTTLMPIFAEQILSMGPDGLGVLLSAPAVGAVVGSAVMSIAPMPKRPGLAIIVAILAYGACIIGFGMSSIVWVSMLFLAGSGAADAVSMALRHTIRNLVTPDGYRGRIAAAHSTFSMGGPQLGEVRAGFVASLLGAPASVAIGGFATILGCLVLARAVPGLARFNVDEPSPNDAPQGQR